MEADAFLPRGESLPLVAAGSVDAAPALAVGNAYALTLRPQAEVTFLRRPAGRRVVARPWAGLARLILPAPGTYRIGTTGPVWIDVLEGDCVLTAVAYNAHPRGNGLHKSVDYVRATSEPLILQFSRALHPAVRIAVRTLAQTPV